MWKPTPEQIYNVDLLISSAERKERELRDQRKREETIPMPPHQCKVNYRTTTDQIGRTWRVEHRH